MSVKLTQNGSTVDIDTNFAGTATFIVSGHIDGVAILAPDGKAILGAVQIGEFDLQFGPNGSGPGGVGRAVYVDNVVEESLSENSIEFDNSNDYIDLNSEVIIPRSTASSISWWEKVKTGSGTYPSRFRFRCDSGNAFNVIRSSDPNYSGLALFDNSSDKKFANCTSVSSAVGVWKHFVLVLVNGPSSTSDSDFILYDDGTPTYASPCPAGTLGNETISRIGYDGGDSPANCFMDDVRVYDHALDQSEVDDLYAGLDVQDGLLHHWAFEEGTGTTTVDSVGNADGTLTNGTGWSTDVPTELS